jgi:hypothetical protein
LSLSDFQTIVRDTARIFLKEAVPQWPVLAGDPAGGGEHWCPWIKLAYPFSIPNAYGTN